MKSLVGFFLVLICQGTYAFATDYDVERRQAVSFDAFHFEQQAKQGKSYSMQETFEHIRESNLWGAPESVSGEGSTDRQTMTIKRELPELLQRYDVQSILDAPCGDLAWLSQIPLDNIQYTGVDIVPAIIDGNTTRFKDLINKSFACGDITDSKLIRADLILCRDCLVHFSFQDIFRALRNFQASGARYLLMTTFTNANSNAEITTGDWRTLNFQLAPFNFPPPIAVIPEDCSESGDLYKDKSLAMWDLNKIELQ